jgi:hypothetical protein
MRFITILTRDKVLADTNSVYCELTHIAKVETADEAKIYYLYAEDNSDVIKQLEVWFEGQEFKILYSGPIKPPAELLEIEI